MNKYVGDVQIPDRCDALIIGAGIGGLTCANYLAKSGAKVLLVEKHYMPGGYASSFRRGNYYFDAAAHSLGSCRPDGQIGQLIRDHKLDQKLVLVRYDPTDVVVIKNREIFFFNQVEKTIKGLQNQFPKESRAIKKFIDYIINTDTLQLYADLRMCTFSDLLDRYFESWELKSTFSILLGNIGLPSSRASALTAVFLYREYIFDGGYYPKGGMQKFADVLLENFISNGGVVLLLTSAEEICTNSSGSIQSVKIKYLGKHLATIETKAVIANCDPYQLYGKLLRNI